MAVLLFFISAILAISFLIKSRQGCQRHWKTDLILRKWIGYSVKKIPLDTGKKSWIQRDFFIKNLL